MTDPRIAYFDALAEDWDHQEPSAETMVSRMRQHRDLLALKAGEDLLEVGCGTGKTTAWLARQVAPGRVTAVDFSAAMIDRARAKGIDAEFLCADVCEADLGRGRYDVVLCFHAFPHFRDQPGALARLGAALKPAGRLLVMHLAGSEQINRFHAGLSGAVRGDALPAEGDWPGLLVPAGLRLGKLIDREDLYFLEAVVGA